MARPSNHEERLPFPTRPLGVRGGTVEEYIIPEDQKDEILARMWLFAEPPPSLDEELYDLHADQLFRVRDFKVVRENGSNLLVSPYYASSGGSVIDWMPSSWAKGQ